MHIATALALLVFFRRDWIAIVDGAISVLRYRRVRTDPERLAALIFPACIPVGVSGLLLEHTLRTVLGRPMPAAALLFANGLLLLIGERLRRSAAPVAPEGVPIAVRSRYAGPADDPDRPQLAEDRSLDARSDRRLAGLSMGGGLLISNAQILALLPGISRSGVTMVAGLTQGLSHRDAARFSFLLATPVIMAAGVLKIPDMFGPLGAGIGGQVAAGSMAAFICAYLTVRFLERYSRTRTLTPFAIYCLLAEAASFITLAVR